MSWTLANPQDWQIIALEVRHSSGSLRLHVDAEAGLVPDPSWVNARNYDSLQAAVDACPAGGTVFIPAGDYRVSQGGLVVSRPIAISGEPGTRLFPHCVAPNEPILKIDPLSSVLNNVQLRDLYLANDYRPPNKYAGNYGIQCDVGSTGGKVTKLLLERVTVVNMGDDAIHLHALGTNDSYFVFATLRNVEAVLSRGMGLFASCAVGLSVYDSYFNSNADCGLRAGFCEISCLSCGFENNCTWPEINNFWSGQVYLRGCGSSRFEGCHWQNFTSGAQWNRRGIVIENSPGCTVANGVFYNATESGDPLARGIYCSYGGSEPGTGGVMGCVFYGNRFNNVRVAIEIDWVREGPPVEGFPAHDCVIFPPIVDAGTGDVIAPWGKANSGLVVLGRRILSGGEGTSRGVALPAMEGTLPPLSADEAGYVVYDRSQERLAFWNGTQWKRVDTV
jgi:hypothetical protein